MGQGHRSDRTIFLNEVLRVGEKTFKKLIIKHLPCEDTLSSSDGSCANSSSKRAISSADRRASQTKKELLDQDQEEEEEKGSHSRSTEEEPAFDCFSSDSEGSSIRRPFPFSRRRLSSSLFISLRNQ